MQSCVCVHVCVRARQYENEGSSVREWDREDQVSETVLPHNVSNVLLKVCTPYNMQWHFNFKLYPVTVHCSIVLYYIILANVTIIKLCSIALGYTHRGALLSVSCGEWGNKAGG